ncbi:MAG: MCE family protein [Phycisphaerales bacterium]|nr:MAG: MCE family protein [Phycisphaerales bacterium]
MKANYFKVGIFVIGALVLITAAVVTLGAGLIGRKEIHFETYFDESVSGLAVGSPVELRGVRVGAVTEIGFVSDINDIPADSEDQRRPGRYIRVVFAVSPQHLMELPTEAHIARWTEGIAHGLRVRLSFNLITGQAFLEGTYVDPNRHPVLEVTWTPTYIYVPSVPSELTTMKDSIDKIFYRLEELDVEGLVKSMENLFVSLDQAVADARIEEISRAFRGAMTELQTKLDELQLEEISAAVQKVLASVDRAIIDANVPAVSAEVQGLFAESRQTNEKLLHLLADPENQAWQSSIPEAVGRLNRSLARIDRLIASEHPQVDLILVNILQISENLKDLTELLKAQPSGLLRSPAPRRSEALE